MPRLSKLSQMSLVATLVLGLGLVLAVFGTQQTQDTRGRASGGETAGFSIWNGSFQSAKSDTVYATQVTTGEKGGNIKTVSVYIGSAANAPLNHLQVAVYSDEENAPGKLLAKSTDHELVENSWNNVALPAISISPTTKYWLAFSLEGSATQFGMGSGASNTVWREDATYGIWQPVFGTPTKTSKTPQTVFMTY